MAERKYKKKQPVNKDTFIKNRSLFLLLILLIITLIAIGFLFKKALFLLFVYYPEGFARTAIYILFGGFSLIATIVLFGFLESKGYYEKKSKSERYKISGAIVIFLSLMSFLIGNFFLRKPVSDEIVISGNVSLAQNNVPIEDAEIAIIDISGYETKSDHIGNFTLTLPGSLKRNEYELLVKYDNEYYSQKVAALNLRNISIKIEPEIETEKDYKKNISGIWKYQITETHKMYEPKLWRINQDGDNITITEEGSDIEITGYYIHDKGLFSYSFQKPVTSGSKPIEERGEGQIDSTGNRIEGKSESQGLSWTFLLERD